MTEQYKKYFDLAIDNKSLYKAGEVEKGYFHGVEIVNGEYYASLYHLQRHIAKGELKEWLEGFKGTGALMGLGLELTNSYEFNKLRVKYKNQNFYITKYPYSIVLDYFLKNKLEKHTPINTLSLDNFKRFRHLENLDFGPINFFVGTNNSGKSTVVQAILLVLNYLQNKDITRFSLVNLRHGSVNTANFYDALNQSAKSEGLEEISIAIKQGNYDIEVSVTGNEYDNNLAMSKLQIKLKHYTLAFSLTGEKLSTSITKQAETVNETDGNNEIIKDLKDSLSNKKAALKDDSDFNESLKLNDEINRLEKEIKRLEEVSKKAKQQETKKLDSLEFTVDLKPFVTKDLSSVLTELIHLNRIAQLKDDPNLTESQKAAHKQLEADQNTLRRDVEYFYTGLNSLKIYHIASSKGAQSSILRIDDHSNPLAQAANDFFQLRLNLDLENPTRKFISRWLSRFELGVDVKVELIEGEAHSIRIKQEHTDGSLIKLSSMGMGAVQVVLLLLRLSTIIEKTRLTTSAMSPIILIEEPEVNTHPNFQSLLAELFFEIQRDYGFQLIIETHSEYIIRKTQLIGAENKLFETTKINPFRVFYFDKQGPFELGYATNGKFKRNFGNGFYDEAAKSTIQLLKLAKHQNIKT